MLFFFFFFKQKTAYEMRISDWSSDVCSSDLHRRAGLARAVEHAVEHVLDLPAELAQRARADQAAAALERVEHAPDRAQALEVVGAFAPDRQHPVEVVDLLAELLEENLSDFVVDLVTGDFEAAPDAGSDGDGRGDLRAVDLRVVGQVGR